MKTGDWKNKRILVTGASGFLGQHLLSILADRAEVFACSRSEREDPRARWSTLDLADRAAVRHLFEEIRPELVFHLSSLANGARDVDLVGRIFDAEVMATLNILLASEASSVERLLLPGSLEESDPSDVPSSPYAAAKSCSRNYAKMFHLLYGTPVVMTRIFMCYGPGQTEWKLIPYTISCLKRGEPPRIASPDRLVDWIYAGDAAEGLIAAISAPGAIGASVDVGSGETHSIREVVQMLRAIVDPAIPVELTGEPRAHEQVRRADASLTEELTGWRARTSLGEGLRLTVHHHGHGPRRAPSSQP